MAAPFDPLPPVVLGLILGGFAEENLRLALRIGRGPIATTRPSRTSADLEVARTVAVNTIVMCEIFYLFNVRRMGRAGTGGSSLVDMRTAFMASALVLLLQVVFTYLPAMQGLFGTAPLEAGHWVAITAVACGVYFIVELEKRLLYASRSLRSS